METILIADDEEEIVKLISFYMRNNGYRIFKAGSGKEALKVFEQEDIDLMILDIMMPMMDGKEVLKQVRKKSQVPVLFLSAKGDDLDKIEGLVLGADDYLSKPFNPMELMARVQAVLRRSSKHVKTEEQDSAKVIGDLLLDEKTCRLYKKKVDLKLTAQEYKLINFMMKNANRVFTKAQLYEQVWEADALGDDNIIMVYVSKLREKIEDHPKEPQFIKTVKGLGYIFEGEVLDEKEAGH